MNKFKIARLLSIGVKRSRLNRFGISHIKRKYINKCYSEDKKYSNQKDKFNKDIETIINKLISDGFKEVITHNNECDYICIDYNNKEFIWSEKVLVYFYIKTFNKIENSKQKTTLRELYAKIH